MQLNQIRRPKTKVASGRTASHVPIFYRMTYEPTAEECHILNVLSVRWGKPPEELFNIAVKGMLAAGLEYFPKNRNI